MRVEDDRQRADAVAYSSGVLAFYAGAYGRVAWMHLTSRGYDPRMDYAAGLVGLAGAVLGGPDVVGAVGA
jgi:hypothetical protein